MIQNINIKELNKIINTINIIDIRNVEKYNDNHMPNAINIPKPILLKYYRKYLSQNKKYYIYCQNGKSSINVCLYLANQGYAVCNIEGGYENWILNS